MKIERYRVTGRLRMGPGDSILLTNAELIAYLKRLGVIEEKPLEIFNTVEKPEKKGE